MPPPEASDGWLAQLVYLGSIALAGLVAWLSQYRRGRREDNTGRRNRHILPEGQFQTHAILEAAEIADMRAIRAATPKLDRIIEQLKQTYEVVAENHRIVEDNHRIVEQNQKMLAILERWDRHQDVDEEVKEQERQRKIDAFLSAQKGGSGST